MMWVREFIAALIMSSIATICIFGPVSLAFYTWNILYFLLYIPIASAIYATSETLTKKGDLNE